MMKSQFHCQLTLTARMEIIEANINSQYIKNIKIKINAFSSDL